MHQQERMEITKQVASALVSLQNLDGGIPAGNDGDVSGSWTTAATLLGSLPIVGYTAEIEGMVRYLASSIVVEWDGRGGWPDIRGPVSTMATGQPIQALREWKRCASSIHGPLVVAVEAAIQKGCKWLLVNQSAHSGGWAPEDIGGKQGSPTIMATTSAMAALDSRDPHQGAAMRRGVQFLLAQQDVRSGGWADPPRIGLHRTRQNVADTARAITCLREYGGVRIDSPVIKRGIGYINNAAKEARDLRTEKVSLRVSNSSYETVVNKNTICDIMGVLARSREFHNQIYLTSIKFLLSSVDEDTSLWYLSDSSHRESLTTWPSADWLIALNAVDEHDPRGLRGRLGKAKNAKCRRLLLWSLPIVGVFVGLFLMRNVLSSWWLSLASEDRAFILTGVMMAIILGVFSNALWDAIKATSRRIRESILRKRK